MQPLRSAILAALVAVVVACGLAACNSGNGVVTVASTQSGIRVVNLIPNAPAPMVISLDDDSLLSNSLPFEASTPYQTIKAGTHTLKAFVSGAPSNLIASTVATLGEANYSWIIFGPINAPLAQLFDDTVVDSGAGNFNFRVINSAAGIGTVDVYLTAPGADLNQVAPSVANVGYASVTGFGTLPFGTLELRVTLAGSKDVIFDSVPQNYAERGSYEAVVYSRGSSRLVGVDLLNVDSSGGTNILTSFLSQFKVINASLVASPLNVFFDGVLKLSNIPIGGATGYQRTTIGQHTLAVEATATPGATLLTYAPVLVPAMDVSVVLEGPAGAMQAISLDDNNLPPGPGNARIRIVNTSPDIPLLDVFVDFSKRISSLPQNSGAYSLELVADAVSGTAFQFSFNIAGTAQTVLTVPPTTLIAGGTYTLYVIGSNGALTGAVTRDN
jgi:hypothetical protein